MMEPGVPYFDLLMRLADYQHKVGAPVRFRFQREIHHLDGSPTIVLHPVSNEVATGETLPLFTCGVGEPLTAWVDYGYILLLDGRISRGEGVFLLTSKTILLCGVY